MTTACAWCDSVQSVDLVALCRSGLSPGVCPACMPRVFGRRAFEAYLAKTPGAACQLCVNGVQLERPVGNKRVGPVPTETWGANA